METVIVFTENMVNGTKFQKNLVVWKLCFTRFSTPNLGRFQKNLVVWKRKKIIDEIILIYQVSEELSSVETPYSKIQLHIRMPCFRRT